MPCHPLRIPRRYFIDIKTFFLCTKHFQRPRLDGPRRSFLRQKKAAAHCGSGYHLLSGRYFCSKHSELYYRVSNISSDFSSISGFSSSDSPEVISETPGTSPDASAAPSESPVISAPLVLNSSSTFSSSVRFL